MQETQMSLQDLQNNTDSFDPSVTNDDFLDQMLSGLQTTVWSDVSAGDGDGGQNKSTLPWDVDHFEDQSTILSSKLRQHQITGSTGGRGTPSSALKSLQLPRGLGSNGEAGLFSNDNIDDSNFKSPMGDNSSIQNLFHGFTGSLTSNQTTQFRHLQAQTFGSPGAAVMNQVQAASVTAGVGGAPSQPRQRVRARRGQATDPHSIAERLRRERIAERMKALQELVPNANKTDKASMLDEIIDYVKFLQLQVKVLSMSRLGGAAAGAGSSSVVPGGAEIAEVMTCTISWTKAHCHVNHFRNLRLRKSQKHIVSQLHQVHRRCLFAESHCHVNHFRNLSLRKSHFHNLKSDNNQNHKKGGGEGSGGRAGRSSNGTVSSSNNDTMTVTENQVVKLMEEDMGSAMQYLQGKGLCLMPISLATAISTATCHPSGSRNNHPLGGASGGEGGGPSSPNMSALTVQSANGVSVKDSP